MDFARYAQHAEMIDLLTPFTRDVWSLAFAGKVDRLRELLATDPALARAKWSIGVTPLMRLPNDEAKSTRDRRALSADGADASIRNADGLTAADLAERRGLSAAASALRRRERS